MSRPSSRGAALFGCQPYLPEPRYRERWAAAASASRTCDVLAADLGPRAEPVAPLGTRLDVRLAMLQYPISSGSANELRWFVAEMGARRVHRDASAAARGKLISETRAG